MTGRPLDEVIAVESEAGFHMSNLLWHCRSSGSPQGGGAEVREGAGVRGGGAETALKRLILVNVLDGRGMTLRLKGLQLVLPGANTTVLQLDQINPCGLNRNDCCFTSGGHE